MKRIPWKELFFVSAPIGVLGLGIWGVQVREQVWPTKARVVECRVRPPAPLEVFLGADVGVTVRAVHPTKPQTCRSLHCLFARPQNAGAKQNAPGKKPQGAPVSVWIERYSEIQPRRIEFENNYAFRRADFSSSQQLLIATPQLRMSCTTAPLYVPQTPVELSAKEIAPVDAASMRRSNFRVTKALVGDTGKGRRGTQQLIELHFEDVTDESPELNIRQRVVGNWKWQGGINYSLRASDGTSYGLRENISSTQVRLHTEALKLPPPAGTKISGLLSLNGGWPQEITVVWPEKLDQKWAFTEAKFTAKLAPVPPVPETISQPDTP